MEIEFLEKLVKDEFHHLSIDDRRDLINTAWLFLAENNIFQASELNNDLLNNLKRNLRSELNQVNWREVRIENLGKQSLSNTSELNLSEDEKFSFIKGRFEQVNRIDIAQELEKAALVFESRKEELNSLLPPVLFEAMHRKILSDASIKWTAGFEEKSLKILCWRALMRLKWSNQSD